MQNRKNFGPLDRLRNTTRVELSDRPKLASALGQLASRISPGKPERVAKDWFDASWQGDRWEKRLRYIKLPGDKERDPARNDSYISTGADWARLIEVAVDSALTTISSHNDGQRLQERNKLIRQVLNGTSFRPNTPIALDQDRSARRILADLARETEDHLRDHSGLSEIWASRPKYDDRGRAIPYSDHFHIDLGYRVYRRTVSVFVVPPDVIENGKNVTDGSAASRCIEWLLKKNLLAGDAYRLPSIMYDDAIGYGWREIETVDYDFVKLSIDEKPDGTPGLKLWVGRYDDPRYCVPNVPGEGIIDIISSAGADVFLPTILEDLDDRIEYEFVDWSNVGVAQRTSEEGEVLPCYFIVDDFRELPDEPSGWLDDVTDDEVNALLFSNEPKSWFYPVIDLGSEIEVPCVRGTVAAALFANLALPREQMVSHQLVAMAEEWAHPKLNEQASLLYEYEKLVRNMFNDEHSA